MLPRPGACQHDHQPDSLHGPGGPHGEKPPVGCDSAANASGKMCRLRGGGGGCEVYGGVSGGKG